MNNQKREIRNPWLIMALAKKKRNLLLSKYEIIKDDEKLDKLERMRYNAVLRKLKCDE